MQYWWSFSKQRKEGSLALPTASWSRVSLQAKPDTWCLLPGEAMGTAAVWAYRCCSCGPSWFSFHFFRTILLSLQNGHIKKLPRSLSPCHMGLTHSSPQRPSGPPARLLQCPSPAFLFTPCPKEDEPWWQGDCRENGVTATEVLPFAGGSTGHSLLYFS